MPLFRKIYEITVLKDLGCQHWKWAAFDHRGNNHIWPWWALYGPTNLFLSERNQFFIFSFCSFISSHLRAGTRCLGQAPLIIKIHVEVQEMPSMDFTIKNLKRAAKSLKKFFYKKRTLLNLCQTSYSSKYCGVTFSLSVFKPSLFWGPT